MTIVVRDRHGNHIGVNVCEHRAPCCAINTVKWAIIGIVASWLLSNYKTLIEFATALRSAGQPLAQAYPLRQLRDSLNKSLPRWYNALAYEDELR